MTASLSPDRAPFLADPGARIVIGTLAEAGGETRFVGGCVRDAVLGRPGTDIDLATTMAAADVMTRLEARGIEVVPTGIDHGTVTAVFGGRPIEVTTLRRDVETHGRRATVTFTDDWREDAARRDFTMNALYAGADGGVFDYFGGVADARAGRVRFVGDASMRVREDYLRILRYFRFHAWYGRPPPDEAALAAVRAAREGLRGIARERIRQELLKLLASPDPVPTCRLMEEAGVLPLVLDGPGHPGRLARLAETGVLARLAALLPEDADAAALAAHLRLSRAEGRRLVGIAALAGRIRAAPTPAEARALAFRHEADVVREAVAVAEARGRAPGAAAAVAEALAGWRPPVLPVRGRDVRALGIPAGEAVGRLLRDVEAWWIAEDFRPGREACLARLRATAKAAAREAET